MAHLGAPQVSRREELAIVDRGEAVCLYPLAVATREVIDEQELVGPIHAVHCLKLPTKHEAHHQRGSQTFCFNLVCPSPERTDIDSSDEKKIGPRHAQI